MKTIDDLPLFPLNTVLFPGMLLPLHIFEMRYKQMVHRCLDDGTPFGVVLIKQGQESQGPLPAIHRIGCTAKIVQVQKLKEGRMNLVTLGRDRFQIQELLHDHAYLSANVRLHPFQIPNAKPLLAIGENLLPWVHHYLDLLSRFSESEFESDFLPESPLPLAFTAAQLLQIETYERQPLLESKDAIALLRELLLLYRREVTLVRHMLEHKGPELFGNSSTN
jgi:hypothetical protein